MIDGKQKRIDEGDPQKLKGIQITYSLAAKDQNFEMDYDEFNERPDYDEVIYLLKKDDVEYSINEKTIVTSGGVSILFGKRDTVEKINNF